MAVNRPEVWFGLALNADPNDPNIADVWNDFTSNVRKISGLVRGRQFELDQPLASEPTILIRDVDEVLNPANLSSPYSGLVQPYRASCLLAQWPNGGTGNLINTGTWRGNKVDVFDPSFDSYTTGAAAPNWTTAVGGVTPLVSSTSPFQGSRCVRWSTAATNTRQGVTWPVACIPGRQYTTSVYVSQSTANTTQIRVTDQVKISDTFRRNTSAGSAGTPDLGPAWTVTGGSADTSVSWTAGEPNGLLTCAISAANVDRFITAGVNTREQAQFARFPGLPALPTSGSVRIGMVSNYTDTSNHYIGCAEVFADGTVSAVIAKRVAGVLTGLASVQVPVNPLQDFNVYLTSNGQSSTGFTQLFGCWVWQASQARPSESTGLVAVASDASTAGNTCGLFFRTSGNVPYPVQCSQYQAVCAVDGTSTTVTGSYQRLTAIWTATQPIHTVRIATQGLAGVGTVDIDALQHEQGAAASAFTTTGPVIYPVMRNFVEQWPRVWDAGGFEGYVEAPCVDGLAVLQSISIETEYAQAVLNTSPDFYYRLNDGTETGVFADTSGNGQPPLVRYISKYGPGTDIEPGTQTAIPGSPGGVGVKFTQSGSAGSAQAPATALGSALIGLPALVSSGGNWGFTYSCWASTTLKGGGGTVQALGAISRGPNPGNLLAVMFFEVDEASKILSFNMSGPSASASQSTGALPQIFDGLPHHYVATVNVVGANVDLAVWVDGVEFSGTYVISSWPSSTAKSSLMTVGLDTAGITGFGWNGIISDVAMWNRRLSDPEITVLVSAGQTAYNGETSGARILRRLTDNNRYSGSMRITQQSGDRLQTAMQAPTWTGTKDLLSDNLETSSAEQGTVWAAPDGAIVAESRQDRWLRLTPVFTLGENEPGGEIPYLMDGARFVQDPLYVYANVQIGRIDGATAQGGTVQDIAVASRRYFSRSVQAGFDFYSDDIAQSMANWIFNTHDAPVMRVDELTVDPSSNPALWPFALGLEIGQRGTAKRRPKAANAGAGITMSADYFVEKIGIEEIDFDTWEWTYRVQLSPINAGGQPSFQPWILNDATYSVLNSTSIPGW